MDIFEHIRDRIPLADVVGRFTELKRSGSGQAGRCPLPNHQDSTPSFCVYADDQAHCFGCGFHGDVIDLWARVHNLQPIEAALDLAREYSIPLPDRNPAAARKAQERRDREETFARQAKVCHRALDQHSNVKDWWLQRGFSEDLQRAFLLGSNRDGSAATIPYFQRGRILGLIRRNLNGEPKYLYPSCKEFSGPKPLFIVGPAYGDPHMVEGIIDALALAALGMRAAAVGGTAISQHQKEELSRLRAEAIYILPDADERGAEAGRRWATDLFPQARLCPAEYGESRKDFADLFAAEGGLAAERLKGLKGEARDALDLVLSEAPQGTAREQYRYAREQVLPLLVRIEDEGERNAATDDAAKALGLKATDLRRALKTEEPSKEDQTKESGRLELKDPEPWPTPVDGAALLSEIASTTCRFVSLPSEMADAIALWVAFAHAHDAFDVSPILAITSPEKRCGKTTLLTILSVLLPRPVPASNITAAALFRTIEKQRPTLLIDEADSFLTGNEELRGILNCGHRRAIAYVIRTTGQDFEPQTFTTWSPKVIALIGSLPGTLEDRSIPVKLQRKRSGESLDRLRFDRLGELEHLRRRAARWVGDHAGQLRVSDPDIPAEITNDRARDNWRPLLSIADLAGGEWPQKTRTVAISMTNQEPDSESPRTMLLADLKAIFEGEEGGERIPSEDIVRSLIEMESRPWAEWRKGFPITKQWLARLLRHFEIKPTEWRPGEGKAKVRGYERASFEDAFTRYLVIKSGQSGQALESTDYSENESGQDIGSVPTRNNGNLLKTGAVPTVPTSLPEMEREEF